MIHIGQKRTKIVQPKHDTSDVKRQVINKNVLKNMFTNTIWLSENFVLN